MPAAGMTDATRSEPANALDRDALADERTLLANERTFSAWTRTALAVTGIALGLHAMFGSVHPTWVAKALATVFIALGVALMLVAERRARAVLARLSNRQVNTIGSMDTRSITIVYTIAAPRSPRRCGRWIDGTSEAALAVRSALRRLQLQIGTRRPRRVGSA